MQIRYKVIIAIAAAMVAFGTMADVLDPRSRHLLDAQRKELRQRQRVAPDAEIFYPAILRLNEGTTLAELEGLGVKILRQRDDLVLAFVPTDHIDRLITFSGVERMSLSAVNHPTMDRALPFSNAIHLIKPTAEMPQVWTGKGVVVGLTDIGIDPNHPHFLTPDGTPRIKRMAHYLDTLGVRAIIHPTDNGKWHSDNSDEWHGTHVLGIMAGSSTATPYLGIASEAEIVASASMLTDACILDGVEEIIDYAKTHGMPAVVNMSVGSYTGPHDGTALFNQYLDKLGEEAIICMSAGNEGSKKGYFRTRFDQTTTSKSVCITDVKWWNCQRNYGSADFWSLDGREFQLSLAVRDMSTQSIVATFPLKGDESSRTWEIASAGCATTDYAEINEEFSNYYKGYFRLTAGTDPDNGRFRIYTSMDLSCTDRIGEMGRYFVTVTLHAEPGVTVDAYADAYQLEFNHGGSSRFAQPDASRSISDIACGHNVIVVGGAVSRNTAPSLAGPLIDYSWFTEGTIGDWSSYGTLDDGRSLPHIAAPGCYVISSVSGEYVRSHPDEEGSMSAKATVDGKDAWWISEAGTSMASPYVAGVIALMLEVDPTLTVGDVRDIITSTADRDMADASNPRWGSGKFNALAAMRKLLENGGVTIPAGADIIHPIVSVGGNEIVVEYVTDTAMDIAVYSTDGRCVTTYKGFGNGVRLDASHRCRGIYVVRANGHSIKLALR